MAASDFAPDYLPLKAFQNISDGLIFVEFYFNTGMAFLRIFS